MLQKIRDFFQKQIFSEIAADSNMMSRRLKAMVDALGDADHFDEDTDTDYPVHVYAFARNFVEEGNDAPDDEGYVLVTSGMSDRAMHVPVEAMDEQSPFIELIWYVRDLNPEYVHYLRWLAKLPQIDSTWFSSSHRVPMPKPPLSFCAFKTFMFLTPISRTDDNLLKDIEIGGHVIETLCVHLISEAEYAFVKTDHGFNSFMDILDNHDYPLIFDPKRKSYL